jgi:hypothetical protein
VRDAVPFEDAVRRRIERKHDRMKQEIVRNRKGGHRIPTWVLAAFLGLLVAAWALLIIF